MPSPIPFSSTLSRIVTAPSPPRRQDNMIIQSISLLDTLDKDINTFSMRVKEWYGWHFPELTKIVGDNYK